MSHYEITQSAAFIVTQINFQLKYKCQLMYVILGLEKISLYLMFFSLRENMLRINCESCELRGKTNLSSIQINFSELSRINTSAEVCAVITNLRDPRFYGSF